MATLVCILKNDAVGRGGKTERRDVVCRISLLLMRVLSGLNLVLAVPWRGQSPFIENTARSRWETAAFQPITRRKLQERAVADSIQTLM